jgi:hypothetical protein
MKFRKGFVSNSSTTNITVMGIYVDDELAQHLLELRQMEIPSGYDNSKYEIMEIVEGPLKCRMPADSDVVIGLEITQMRMDETKEQFMARAKEEIQKQFPGWEGEIHYINESWYDG